MSKSARCHPDRRNFAFGLCRDCASVGGRDGRAPKAREALRSIETLADELPDEEAGLTSIREEPTRKGPRAYSRSYLCEALKRLADELGYLPTNYEISSDPAVPSPTTYLSTFGSLKAAFEAAGFSSDEIATRRQARKRKGMTTRECLGCDRPFPSEGFHNRLCDPCRENPAETHEMAVMYGGDDL